MARRPPDPRFTLICIDANIVSSQFPPPEQEAFDRLTSLRKGGLMVMLPHTVKAELDHPNTPMQVKLFASDFIFSIATDSTMPRFFPAVRNLLRGSATDNRHDADATHLCEAHKWGGYFITLDRRMVAKAADIQRILDGLWVVKPSEFLAIYDRWFEIDPEGLP